jgi:integrating conjugative element protein (TIGR03758 family)
VNETALKAWEMAAGVSASSASLTIRTILLVIVMIWAAWCIYGELHYFRHHGIDFFDALRKNLRVLWVISITVVLVFIS